VPVRTRTLSSGNVRRPSLVSEAAPSAVELPTAAGRATGQKVVPECVRCDCVCRVGSVVVVWFAVGKQSTLKQSSCLYRASMTIKTLYYPTDVQIYN